MGIILSSKPSVHTNRDGRADNEAAFIVGKEQAWVACHLKPMRYILTHCLTLTSYH